MSRESYDTSLLVRDLLQMVKEGFCDKWRPVGWSIGRATESDDEIFALGRHASTESLINWSRGSAKNSFSRAGNNRYHIDSIDSG